MFKTDNLFLPQMIKTFKRSIYLIGLTSAISLWIILFLFFILGMDFWGDTHVNGVPLEETTCWTSTNCD
jgi:hypothetical protein